MSSASPRVFPAGPRESDQPCPHCRRDIAPGATVAVCSDCGTAQHEPCWHRAGGCGSYDCAPAARPVEELGGSVLRITADDLARSRPVSVPAMPRHDDRRDRPESPVFDSGPPWNRLAVASLVTAVAGIALAGFITGLVSILLACVAGLRHRRGQRGAWCAVAAVGVGLVEFVGWTTWLSHRYGVAGPAPAAIDESAIEQEIDPATLADLPPAIARAMRANVMIRTDSGGTSALGSGVILRLGGGFATIVTNRHVVDPAYARTPNRASDRLPGATLRVKILGQPPVAGTVEWIAPHGIDLAVIRAASAGLVADAAPWDPPARPRIGGSVFAVGNPHGLGWTHTEGAVSQIRSRGAGPILVSLIQTSAAINSGNSGGGLYDSQGQLLGINTFTHDKRFAEGLGFAVALQTLLELAPPGLSAERPDQP